MFFLDSLAGLHDLAMEFLWKFLFFLFSPPFLLAGIQLVINSCPLKQTQKTLHYNVLIQLYIRFSIKHFKIFYYYYFFSKIGSEWNFNFKILVILNGWLLMV